MVDLNAKLNHFEQKQIKFEKKNRICPFIFHLYYICINMCGYDLSTGYLEIIARSLYLPGF